MKKNLNTLEKRLKLLEKGHNNNVYKLSNPIRLNTKSFLITIKDKNLSESAKIEDLICETNVTFENCNIDCLTFVNCKIYTLKFINCTIQKLEISENNNNRIKDIEFFNCKIDTLCPSLFSRCSTISNCSIRYLKSNSETITIDSCTIGTFWHINHSSLSVRNSYLKELSCDGSIGYCNDSIIEFSYIKNLHYLLTPNFGDLAEDLTRLCMAYDAQNHPNPDKFDEWGNGGPCPYSGTAIGRISFSERRLLWSPELKTLVINIPNFVQRLYEESLNTKLIW